MSARIARPGPPRAAAPADVGHDHGGNGDGPAGDRVALTVEAMTVEFGTASGPVRVLCDVSFELRRGRILGLVGESGSGKSTAALAAIGWRGDGLRAVSGSSHLGPDDLLSTPEERLRRLWGGTIGYVPQEIGGALHPTFRIRSQFREALRVNRGLGRRAADARALELLAAVDLPAGPELLRRHPHQFSGGQLQRLALALALAPEPEVLVLDEPTTGLDVTSQRQVAGLLARLCRSRRVAALFVSHDLALVGELADDLAVLYAGEVVEAGPAATVLARPRHPYTRALLDAVPSPDRAVVTVGIPGLPPGRVVEGSCGFAPRCPHADHRCTTTHPALLASGDPGDGGTGAGRIGGGDQDGGSDSVGTGDGGPVGRPGAPGIHLVRCLRAGELTPEPAAGRVRVRSDRTTPVLLRVEGATCSYRSGQGRRVVLSGVSLEIREGAVSALVGESGSGKSTLGRAIAGIHPLDAGTITLDGEPLPGDPRRRSDRHRRDIRLVFQDATASLNPRITVGDHLTHVATRLADRSTGAPGDTVADLLDAVRLPASVASRYPAQLSGGQRQRVAIAAAFVGSPRLVVCDEITSGQDVSVQASLLETLAAVREERGTSLLFISHDLGVVRSIADDLDVLRAGRIVESGPAGPILAGPVHPYTVELLRAAPSLDRSNPDRSRRDGDVER